MSKKSLKERLADAKAKIDNMSPEQREKMKQQFMKAALGSFMASAVGDLLPRLVESGVSVSLVVSDPERDPESEAAERGERQELLDALARLCGAFSAEVRSREESTYPGCPQGCSPGRYHGDPTKCPAYAEALLILAKGV